MVAYLTINSKTVQKNIDLELEQGQIDDMHDQYKKILFHRECLMNNLKNEMEDMKVIEKLSTMETIEELTQYDRRIAKNSKTINF
jgi:hypothetical protein